MNNLRILLENPENVLFLDIETTGLSRHYDHVTVIGYEMGGVFHHYVHGGDLSHFESALQNASALVTFNGKCFDVKFLEHHFPHLRFPEHHVDLRYVMRRVGYSGGQKAIEVSLGLKREEEIKNVTGYEAVVLWHEYRRGDMSSLKKLLSYNYFDVQGMKDIMLHAFLKEGISSPALFKQKSKLTSTKTIVQESPKPKVLARDLWRKVSEKGPIVGIDLTGSEERASGFAVLHPDNTVTTQAVFTDRELLDLCKESKPTLVSIDSPLSLPKGRIRVTDDDPGRDTFGIMREADRELKRRGINVYPCLLPSMQKLTARGINLAKTLQKMGIPVIESYPGAAQDIMQIPRKQAGLPYLIDGLCEFGMKGMFLRDAVTHDELDAITSAIVGLFYLSGKYEALGSSEENYMIVPKV